jgi:hypothetical protein
VATNQKTKLAYGVLVITAIALGLSGYWLKCHMGINFSENYSLSKYFPFNYLVPRQVISNPVPGFLLDDSFDSFSLFSNWTPLWMREKGKVIKGYDANGIANSRCLFIKSISTKSWSCSYKKRIRVHEGDVFTYNVAVKLQGDNLFAFAGVTTFDAVEKVISWNDFRELTERSNEWVTINKTFTIPEGIAYIGLKISGTGEGEFRFDDIFFAKKHL